jgi:hypothetical protein
MREIPLTRGFTAYVDDEDFDRVAAHKWYPMVKKRTVYAFTSIPTTQGSGVSSVSMHRFILSAIPGTQIDHEDHNGLNNQKSNLRTVTRSQNLGNSRKTLRTVTSRFKGVCWSKKDRKWLAGIMVRGKYVYLGLHKDEEEAARAYDHSARELFGEFADTNF